MSRFLFLRNYHVTLHQCRDDLVETEQAITIYEEMGAPEWLIILLIENELNR
jgi:hypothetical protein